MAYVKCKCCGYKEEANKTFFLKVMGGSFVGGGFTAWVTYFFAGKYQLKSKHVFITKTL